MARGTRMRAAACAGVLAMHSALGLIQQNIAVDVCVYAANPAGIGAAIAASRVSNGTLSIALFEPLTMIGGMGAAGGVGLMNQGCGDAGVTGLGREWGLLNGAYYNPGPNPPLNVFPDPMVAERSFWVMLNATAGISVYTGCHLTAASRAASAAACLQQAQFLCESDSVLMTVNASVFVDASYDGDIMTTVGGIQYANGREAASEFNESLAGVNLLDFPNESFDKQNLSVEATFPDGSLLPGITSDPLPPAGTGDDRVMAYSYFPCVTDDPSNSVPYYMPDGYNASDFTLLQRQIDGVMANGMYPNGPDLSYFSESATYTVPGATKLLLCCGVGPVNCDPPDLNRGWPNANYTQRMEIAAAHKYYLLGSLYYMANDMRVPNFTRYAVGRWGLCKDQYAENNYWPPQIYVRISNRLRGAFLITQNNIANPRNKPDGVSMGCWEFDQHTETRHAVPDPKNASRRIALNEGYMRYELTEPFRPCTHPEARCGTASSNWYDVPFAAITPQRGEASNLMVPVAISATSIAYSSTRIEGMFMDLGTAAGVAAALMLQGGAGRGACPALAVQDVNVTTVQNILVNTFNQRIHGPISTMLVGQ